MKRIFMMLGFSLLSSALLAASMPMSITYQGTLKQGGVPETKPHKMVFALTDVTGLTQYGAPVTLFNVPFNQGLFSVQLDFTNGGLKSVDWQNIKPYIQVSIDDVTLGPPEPINATAYALMSASVADGAITKDKLAPGSVTSDKLDSAVQSFIVPPGVIVAYGGVAAPDGWLPCNGLEVPRTKYPDLWKAIGVTWGAGNSVDTFNLPDLMGRAPIGAGHGSGLSERLVGTKNIGEETHLLIKDEIPVQLIVTDPGHLHPITDPGHVHNGILHPNFSGWGWTGSITPILDDPRNNQQTDRAFTGITVDKAVTNIQVGGLGQPHPIMPPSAVVNYIIKY